MYSLIPLYHSISHSVISIKQQACILLLIIFYGSHQIEINGFVCPSRPHFETPAFSPLST